MKALLGFAWPISESMVERLGWVLVHSLWQFALFALLAGLAIRALRRSSSAARYVVLVVAMAVSVAASVATWTIQPGDLPAHPATASEMDVSPIASNSTLAGNSENAAPTPDRLASSVALESRPGATPSTPTIIQSSPPWPDRAKTVLRPWLAWIVAGWSLGVVLCSLRPLLGWHTLRRLGRDGVSPASDEVLATLQRVSERLGLRRAVRVLQSTLAQVPVVIGYVRPVILLPVSLATCLPAGQLEAILAHELAHVRRHDFVVNLLQTLVETIFFYHPAIWWLSRQIRVEREHCCDDLVVALLGNRVEYGRALVAIEQLRGRNTLLALGAGDGSLLARVRRILGVGADRNAVSLVGRWPAALFGLALIGVTFALTMNWGLAAKDDGDPNGDPARVLEPKKSDEPKGQETSAEANAEEIFSRKVSLTAKAMPLKDALAAVARAAKVELQLEVDALKKGGLDVEQPVTVSIADEPLAEALGQLINWGTYSGVLRAVRGGKLILTTLEAYQAEIARHLPPWLRVHYNRGLLATLDDDGNVVSLTTGEVLSDELLGKFKALPKLRELDVGPTKLITPAGLQHLAELSSLQKLSLHDLSHNGNGLGDAAIKHIVELKSLRELHLNDCGTTDAGARLLETMLQLVHLELYAEPRLTDAAIASIAKLKRLKHLSLNSYVGTEHGWMRFSRDATRSLADLQDLEHLHLVGQDISAETLRFPRLKSLSLGTAAVDDACAARIVECRQLQSLELVYTNISDEGLNKIAGLAGLRRLNLDSHFATDDGIKHLKRLPKLQHISLRASRLTDESLRHLGAIKTLTRVDLNGSGEPGVNAGKCYTIEGVQQLKALPSLRTLWLTNFESAGSFLGLKELTQVRVLTLMMANIRDDDLDALEEALPNTRINAVSGGSKYLPRKDREPAWKAEFRKAYGLRDGELIRRVAPPYPECRNEYFRDMVREWYKRNKMDAPEAEVNRDYSDYFTKLGWQDGWTVDQLKMQTTPVKPDAGVTLRQLIRMTVGFGHTRTEGDATLLDRKVTGDFVVRAGADPEKIAAALEKILRKECDLPASLAVQEVERDVYVLSGKYEAKPLADRKMNQIEVYGFELTDRQTGGGGSGTLQEMADNVEGFIESRIAIGAVKDAPKRVEWHFNFRSPFTEEQRAQDTNAEAVMKNISAQTGLTVELEKRKIRVLVVTNAR